MSYPDDNDPRWEPCANRLAVGELALVVQRDGPGPLDSAFATVMELSAPVVALVASVTADPGTTPLTATAWLTNYSITIPFTPPVVVVAAGLRGRAYFDVVLHELGHCAQAWAAFWRGRGPSESEWAPNWIEYMRRHAMGAHYEGEAEGAVAQFNILGGFWRVETLPDGSKRCDAAANHGKAFVASLDRYGFGEPEREVARATYDSAALTAAHAGVASAPHVVKALTLARAAGLLPTATP